MDNWMRNLLFFAVVFGIIGAVLRYTMFEPWVIPKDREWLTASVGPTLRGGDMVLINKKGDIEFGRLVRCRDPEDETNFVVGRVAGMSHDVVEVSGSRLKVNGTIYSTTEACKEPIFATSHPDTGSEVELRCGRVEMGGGWHFIGAAPKHRRNNNVKREVGAGNVFLISDNRDIHDDSRDYGNVEQDTCDGVVVFRLWGENGWLDHTGRMDVIR